MSLPVDKIIVTHKWGNNPTHDEYTSSNGIIVRNRHYGRTMDDYIEMADQAKKDFPFLKDSDIEPFVVRESSYNKNMAGIRFSLPDNYSKKGYFECSKLDFSY